MNRKIYILLCPLLLCCSCIRDEVPACPALQVTLQVRDKNYANIADVPLEPRKDEDGAFRTFVPTLCYTLRSVPTGEVVDRTTGIVTLTDDTPTLRLSFCPCIPHGTYVLTVWGGLTDAGALAADRLSATLHPAADQGDDMYMATDTLVYDMQHNNQTVELRRVKGKLLVLVQNLPERFTCSEQTIGPVLGRVDAAFGYTDAANVRMRYERSGAQDLLTTALTAPSAGDQISSLSLKLYDNNRYENPETLINSLPVSMKRNELTAVNVVYGGQPGEHAIYLLVDGTWMPVHDMGLE